jgi:beta-lactamase superfamily II metal-dependent hydrolase
MLTMVFWDVQHGHALYVGTETRNIVFDLGTGSYGYSHNEFSPLLHLKSKYGINKLDGVVITHPHSDHLYDIGNFDTLSPEVLHRPKHLTEEEIRQGNAAADKQYVDKYLEINQRYNAPVPDNTNPFRESNNGGVKFQFFTPKSCSRSNLNNHSIVTVISHASSKAIIPGDNESPSWNELLDDQTFKTAISAADILLAPHHGREAGYSEALFEHISPYLTIVSDGAETDTSATDRYSKKSKGWKVHKRDGTTEHRKCLTTRNDGVIVVKFGVNEDKTPFIEVKID